MPSRRERARPADRLTERQRAVDEAEQGLAVARHAQQELARRPDGRRQAGMRARRAALPQEQRRELMDYERSRGRQRQRDVAERGL